VYPLTTGWWRDSLSKREQCAQHSTAVIRCLSKCVKSFLQFKTTLFTQDPQGISQAAMSTTRSLPSGDPRFASAARYLRSS